MEAQHIEMVSASQQTRAHQRDAHIRLGVCTLFVSLPIFLIAKNYSQVGIPLIVVLLVAITLSIFVGFWAYRRGVRISENVQAEDRAARKAEKSAQLAAFIESKGDD